MTPAQIAKEQFDKKNRNVKKLKPKIMSIFRRMAKDLKAKYISSQQLLDASVYSPEFQSAMTERARIVANEFKNSYRETKGIDEDIAVDIADWLAAFIEQQVDFITQTTELQQTQMLQSTLRDLSSEGIMATPEIVAQRISDKMLQSGLARSELIAAETVDTTAEETKDIEMENLIAGGIVAVDKVKKTWFTNIDGKERPTHHMANKQVRRVGEPFNVGNSLMMYPKDRSLGAEGKEIFNCRCSAIYT